MVVEARPLEERTYWGDVGAAKTARQGGSCGGCSGWPPGAGGRWRLLLLRPPREEVQGGGGAKR